MKKKQGIQQNIKEKSLENKEPDNNSPAKESKIKTMLARKKIDRKLEEAELKQLEEKAENISVTEEVRQAEKTVKKQKTKIQGFLNFAFFVINITCFIGVLYFVYLYFGRAEFGDLFFGPDELIFFICGVLGVFIVTMFIKTLRIYLLILKHTKKSRWFLSLKTVCIGKFYDFITPLSTGGQAHQINYLYKSNIKASVASSIPITKHVFENLVFLISSVLLLAFGSSIFSIDSLFIGFVSVWAYIGIGFNFLIMFIIILLSNEKKIGRGITIGCLKLLYKIKIIKDYKDAYIKVMKFVGDYQRTMRATISNFPLFLGMLFSSVLVLVIRLSIPFILHTAFFGMQYFTWEHFINMAARMLVCELAFGFWILPGNIVVSDLAFIALFKESFTRGTGRLWWAILIWRLITYYIYLVQGETVIFADFIKRKVKKHKIKNERRKHAV